MLARGTRIARVSGCIGDALHLTAAGKYPLIAGLAAAAIDVYTRRMSNSSFSVGDRVMRVNDGKIGVVTLIGPGGDLGVRWEPSGVVQMVVPGLLRPA